MQQRIENQVLYFLGCVAREIQPGQLAEENIENCDHTHFQINMNNELNLGFRGNGNVKYADVTSGGRGMNLMVQISGGRLSVVEVPFLIFNKWSLSYQIPGVPDDIPGVFYRTGPKGWIDGRVLKLWSLEPRALPRFPDNRCRVLLVGSSSSHNMKNELKSL